MGIANTEFEGENYYVIIFAKNDVPKTQTKAQIQTQAQSKVQSQPQVLSQSEQIEGEPELPNIDLSELKQAFDLYDTDGSQRINMKECIDGMKLIGFDKTNPILFDIIKDLEENE